MIGFYSIFATLHIYLFTRLKCDFLSPFSNMMDEFLPTVDELAE
jgi:hypothetical protein